MRSGGIIVMSESENNEIVRKLTQKVKESPGKRIALESARELIEEWSGKENIDGVIAYVLDNWVLDKVVDYPAFDGFVPLGFLTWFLKYLDKDESEYLRNLAPEAQALIKILRSCNVPHHLGELQEDLILKQLHKKRYSVDEVPFIRNKVDEFLTLENGSRVRWHRLIPEFELAENDVDGLTK